MNHAPHDTVSWGALPNIKHIQTVNTTTSNTYHVDLRPTDSGGITYKTDGDGVTAKSMRRVRDNWPMAYNKLLSLRWEATSATTFGATDGRRLLLNPVGIAKICETSNPVGYMSFLLVHEALHALLNHGTRLRKFADHQTANIAADYVINAMIKRQNLHCMKHMGWKRPPFPMIVGCLIDEALSLDKEVEQLYSELMKAKPQEPEQDSSGSQDQDSQAQPSDEGDEGDGDGDSTGGEGTGEDANATPEGDEGNSNGGDESNAGGQSGSGSDTTDGEGDSSSAGGGYKPDDQILGDEWVGSSGGEDVVEPELDDSESMADAENSIDQQNAEISLTDEMNEVSGVGGGGGRIEIDKHRNGGHDLDTPWEDVIRQWMTYSSYAGWVSPFNQQVYQAIGMVACGRGGKAIKNLAFIVDTSGSMSGPALRSIMENIQVVLDELQPRNTTIISCDSMVREVVEVELGDTVPDTLEGGGGTAFQPALNYVEQNIPDCEGIIYLTDGYSLDLYRVSEPTAPLLWLTYGKPEDAYPVGDAIRVRLYD